MLPTLLRSLRPLVPKTQYVRALSQFSTIDAEEVKKFSAKSAEWWDPHGEFGMLHLMNPTRVSYIRDRVTPGTQETMPFKGLKMLDIGCGGGLLSEVKTSSVILSQPATFAYPLLRSLWCGWEEQF